MHSMSMIPLAAAAFAAALLVAPSVARSNSLVCIKDSTVLSSCDFVAPADGRYRIKGVHYAKDGARAPTLAITVLLDRKECGSKNGQFGGGLGSIKEMCALDLKAGQGVKIEVRGGNSNAARIVTRTVVSGPNNMLAESSLMPSGFDE